MPTKIDLHVHTDFSDGRQSPEEVVKLAASKGVKFLAAADHEGTRSFVEVKQAAKKAGGTVIPAVEITTNYQNSVLHILGYNFDPKNKLMQQLSKLLLKNREQKIVERMQHVKKALEQSGRGKLDLKDFALSQKGFFNRWKAQDYLIEKKLVKNHFEAGRLLVGVKIAVPDISPAAAIQLVHQAGGKAVLAHPFGPKISLPIITKDVKKQNLLIEEFKEQGLDGIECFQPSHGTKETKKALLLAKKFGLVISAGSDWHGPLNLTGKGILEYIPHYVKAPGQFSVPTEVQKQMVKHFF
jgi:3',5'-nucleoside bisphosphate phosphatase